MFVEADSSEVKDGQPGPTDRSQLPDGLIHSQSVFQMISCKCKLADNMLGESA
jgi:hypothetical protein